MRVMVALENRFLKTRSGNIYSTTVCDYNFWKRYLQVFDEVIVFARVAEIPEIELDKPAANGPNVSFISLPTFIGPWQYLKHRHELKILAKKALPKADAYILRIPGIAASLLWHCLEKERLPYGVEVVGHAWSALGKQTVKSLSRPFARHIFAREQKKQCQGAIAAAYVSEQYLQRDYPAECWTTHYSSLDLPDDSIIDGQKFAERLASLRNAVNGKRPFRICHIGSMSALYKAQDVLIEAVAICRREGFNVELTLLGDGKYKDVFLAEAEQLEISDFVKFAGRVPPGQAVVEYLDAADIFVLPSLTEGLPRALIEAMARGLPCIGTNVGGITELLVEEDTVAPRKADELAKKMIATMCNFERLEQMASRNLEKANEYRASELNKRRIEFYNKIVEKTKVYQRFQFLYEKHISTTSTKDTQMRLNNYVVCQDILGIQTNSKYIGWSFGHPSQAVSDEEINKCGLVVRLIADSLKSKLDELRDLEKFHYWLGAPGRDELFYERNFFAGTKLRLLVRGIRSERPEIFANKNYLRFIRFRFNNLHSPGYLLTDLVCALLLSKGLCPLHCSGFSIGDCTVAVIAPPDTGKTLTTMHAVLNAGASFISEDLGITDGEYFYACPWTSTFRYYDELSSGWLLRLKMKLMKVFPLAEFLPVPGECKTIEKYIDEKRIAAKTKITHIAILARRSGGVEVLDKERARQIILNLNRYEFMYMKSPMLTAYSYFNPEFDVQAMVAAEREILTKLANKTTCLLVQSIDPSKFSDLILEKIKEQS